MLILCVGKCYQVMVSKVNKIVVVSGVICSVKLINDSLEWFYNRIFCGLLIGVNNDFVFIVSVEKIIRCEIGKVDIFFSVKISGIMINNVILLVKKEDNIVVDKIKNSVRCCFVCNVLIIF